MRERKSIESRRREVLAEWAAAQAVTGSADVTVLYWPTDHGEAVEAGLIELTADEYRQRVEAAEKRIEDAGCPHLRLTASAADVVEFMRQHDLSQTPEGRSSAYALMLMERGPRK